MTAFWHLPLLRIEGILRHWLSHRIPLLRLLGRGLKGLCLQALVSMPGVHSHKRSYVNPKMNNRTAGSEVHSSAA